MQNPAIDKIIEAIRKTRYGEVLIKIQDSRIVQIDRLEKLRLDKEADARTQGKKQNI